MNSRDVRLTEATRVLIALSMGGFAPVVAGGYLRDTMLGIAPKDMDVFIPHCLEKDNERLRNSLGLLLGGPVHCQFNISQYANLEVCRIFTLEESLTPVPVQIIELNRGLSPTAREMDFGLCQIWMTADGAIHTTEAFQKDLREKTFTLLAAENEDEHRRSLRRWERLKVKLEPLGFRFVDASKVTQ